MKRLLVPLDLNRLSEAKIPVAEAQARALDAEIILLHVLAPDQASGEAVSPAEARARTYLDAISARLHSEGIEARPLIRYGPTAETILAEIATQKADLVILGSNVRQGLSRLLLGSVAEEIVARATCPLLLVRPSTSLPADQPALRNFAEDAAQAGPVAPQTLGLRTVDVARIVGSVGRARELDKDFRSLQRRAADEARYQRIVQVMAASVRLPPVSLYKLGYGYYVLDGNHRVAAAKRLGHAEIQALVTEFLPLGDPQRHRVFAERRAFEWATGLKRIGAMRPGNYPQLEGMIRAYSEERGLNDLREAARRWEAETYQPVARKIRALRLAQKFPGERTADVFVRVAAFREEETTKQGRLLDWNEAMSRCAAAAADEPGLTAG